MISRRHNIPRSRVVVVLVLAFSAVHALLPPAGHAHRHDRDTCGPDVNELAGVLLRAIQPRVAAADSFEVRDELGACGDLTPKTTFVNESDFPVEHTFRKTHSKRTEYSVSVGAGFKGAFEAKMGYKADKTATEEFVSKVVVAPRRGAELYAAPSLHVVVGTWRHGFAHRKKTTVEVARPTGHIKWILRNLDPS